MPCHTNPCGGRPLGGRARLAPFESADCAKHEGGPRRHAPQGSGRVIMHSCGPGSLPSALEWVWQSCSPADHPRVSAVLVDGRPLGSAAPTRAVEQRSLGSRLTATSARFRRVAATENSAREPAFANVSCTLRPVVADVKLRGARTAGSGRNGLLRGAPDTRRAAKTAPTPTPLAPGYP